MKKPTKLKDSNPSGMRFEKGTQECGICGTKRDIVQIETKNIIKKIPVVEIMFICRICAKENGIELLDVKEK
jgi:hypothetical protein